MMEEKIPYYALMYVTDERIREEGIFFDVLEKVLQGGVGSVQLREKKLSTRDFLYKAKLCKELCQKYQVPLVINDRIDIALAVDADGVHLGQKDMPVQFARKVLKDRIIGLSVSNEAELLESNHLPIDYIGISPVFSTGTKTEDLEPPVGLGKLKTFRTLTLHKMVGIGGIQLENAEAVLKSGADGLAIVSAISQANDVKDITTQFKNIVWKTGIKK